MFEVHLRTVIPCTRYLNSGPPDLQTIFAEAQLPGRLLNMPPTFCKQIEVQQRTLRRTDFHPLLGQHFVRTALLGFHFSRHCVYFHRIRSNLCQKCALPSQNRVGLRLLFRVGLGC